jgi:hypothetical protein
MLRAHVATGRKPTGRPKGKATEHYHVQQLCQYPGCTVMVNGWPRKYCPEHAHVRYLEHKRLSSNRRRKGHHGARSQQELDFRAVQREVAHIRLASEPVKASPGFCPRCGIIRLPKGAAICDGCADD